MHFVSEPCVYGLAFNTVISVIFVKNSGRVTHETIVVTDWHYFDHHKM